MAVGVWWKGAGGGIARDVRSHASTASGSSFRAACALTAHEHPVLGQRLLADHVGQSRHGPPGIGILALLLGCGATRRRPRTKDSSVFHAPLRYALMSPCFRRPRRRAEEVMTFLSFWLPLQPGEQAIADAPPFVSALSTTRTPSTIGSGPSRRSTQKGPLGRTSLDQRDGIRVLEILYQASPGKRTTGGLWDWQSWAHL